MSYLVFIFLKGHLATYKFESGRYIIMSTVYIYLFKALVSWKLLYKYVFLTTVVIRGLYESLPTWSQYLYHRSKCFEKSCFSTVIFAVLKFKMYWSYCHFMQLKSFLLPGFFSLYLKTGSSWTKISISD